MIGFMIFLGGLIVGGSLGVLITAMMIVASDSDDRQP